MTCDKDGPGTLYLGTNAGGQNPGDVNVGEARVEGTTGIVDIDLGDQSDVILMPFDYEDGRWCTRY